MSEKLQDNEAHLRPRGDMVMIRRLKVAIRETKGGIQLPEGLQQAFFRAEVLAVGPGHYDGGVLVPIDLEKGDIVLVQDDVRDPNGRTMSRHLLPVTPDGDVYLVIEGLISGVEIGG